MLTFKDFKCLLLKGIDLVIEKQTKVGVTSIFEGVMFENWIEPGSSRSYESLIIWRYGSYSKKNGIKAYLWDSDVNRFMLISNVKKDCPVSAEEFMTKYDDYSIFELSENLYIAITFVNENINLSEFSNSIRLIRDFRDSYRRSIESYH